MGVVNVRITGELIIDMFGLPHNSSIVDAEYCGHGDIQITFAHPDLPSVEIKDGRTVVSDANPVFETTTQRTVKLVDWGLNDENQKTD